MERTIPGVFSSADGTLITKGVQKCAGVLMGRETYLWRGEVTCPQNCVQAESAGNEKPRFSTGCELLPGATGWGP